MSHYTITIDSNCNWTGCILSRTAHDGKPNKVCWESKSHNSYEIQLPAGYFVEYPDGGTLVTGSGGCSAKVTLFTHAPLGVMSPPPVVAGPGCPVAAAGAAPTADSDVLDQSDIMVDP